MSKGSRARLKRRKKLADLDPLYMPRVRREFADQDYVNELSDEEREWLSKFNSEYYGAAITKTKQGTVKKKHLHTKTEHAKEIYDNNNRRNNDLYGVTRINGLLSNLEGQPDTIGLADYTKSEQAMIEALTYQEDLVRDFKLTLVVLALALLHRERRAATKRPSRKKRET